jgi:hypothetical protein
MTDRQPDDIEPGHPATSNEATLTRTLPFWELHLLRYLLAILAALHSAAPRQVLLND